VTTSGTGLVVALDGPASSGKSSVGSAAARVLGYRFCDTGLLYRAATWLAIKRDVPADGDPAAVVALVPEIALVPDAAGRLAHVTVDGEDVTDDVHTPIVDEHVSAISRIPELRSALLERQRALADESGGIIMAGRDIGTVVLPDAPLKVFITARDDVRAARRQRDEVAAQRAVEIDAVRDALDRRDRADGTLGRATRPEDAADDAVVVDTSDVTAEEVIGDLVARAARVFG
jgi:cytidylate kinase